MAQRRKQKTNVVTVVKNGNGLNTTSVAFLNRQDSRLSVKSLIESIENTSKQTKASTGSHSGSTTSLNSLTSLEQQQQQLQENDFEKSSSDLQLNNNIINNNNNNMSGINGTQKSTGK